MIPITKSQTGVGNTSAIPMDYHGRPEFSLQVVVSGTVTWTVQQTLDDPAGSPTWFPHPDSNMVSQVVNRQGNYAYLPRAIRLNVSAGTGTATLTVIQAGLKK